MIRAGSSRVGKADQSSSMLEQVDVCMKQKLSLTAANIKSITVTPTAFCKCSTSCAYTGTGCLLMHSHMTVVPGK